MIDKKRIRNWILTSVSIVFLFLLLAYLNKHASSYVIQILNVTAIYIILTVSYNLINGITGQFSLEPNAFVAIGAYTAALLTMTPQEKAMTFIIQPCISPLNHISIPFLPAILTGGVVTAILAFLMGIPVFRVRGDYLAIVTLGFGEIVRVFATNLIPLTNGALGLKGLRQYTNIWWTWGTAVVVVFFIVGLVNSSYGRAMKAIREDEAAAQAMGINVFWHKMLAFVVAAFFEGVGGGLLAHLLTTIDPKLFTFFLTFNLLIMIVAGGLGSTTGAIIGAIIFAWGSELLRWMEEPHVIFGLHTPGIPGMRMVTFSVLLILLMIFARNGIMGRKEFSWDGLFSFINRKVLRRA